MTHPQRHSSHERGVVMVITVLAVILLAALVFYVINLGRQANARIVAQQSADATAAGGAGWVARSFNTVAMNNTGMARMIVTVDVLDSMPLAIAHAHTDQQAMLEALRGQLSRGVTDRWVRDVLSDMADAVQGEIDMLDPMDDFFNHSGYDVTAMTFYEGPNGRGHLWRAMEAMDEFSQASLENLSVLAQVNASQAGRLNLARDDDAPGEADHLAVMSPLLPSIPWQRGQFDDFERPVKQGLLPRVIDDPETNRGPYDTLYGWRRGGRPTGWETVEGNRPPGRIDTPPISSRPDFGTRGRATGYTRYHTYGPQSWVLNRVGDFSWAQLFFSRFSWWVRSLANIKLAYVWPGGGIKQVTDPLWITDFDQATALAQTDPAAIKTTALARVEVKSRHPRGGGGFMSAGSWAYEDDAHPGPPGRILFLNRWFDPQRRLRNAVQVDSHIWRVEWEYTVYSDPEIGINPQTDENGHLVPQTVYRIDEFTFLGIDTGDEIDVRNPFNFSSKDDLPAPCDFDHDIITTDDDARRQRLTFLAVAQHPNRSLFWPAQFDAGKPYPYTVGIAQISVFNNHSWDLWTQMWQAQVEPVTDYSDWLNRLDEDAAALGQLNSQALPDLDPQQHQALITHLRNIQPLADLMLTH
jgi:hypothetical protein